MARGAFGSELAVLFEGTGSSWVDLTGMLQSITPPVFTAETFDSTTHGSEDGYMEHEYTGRKSLGPLTAVLLHDEDNDAIVNFRECQEEGIKPLVRFKISTGETWTFEATVNSVTPGGNQADGLISTVELQPSGKPDYSTGG